MDRMRTVVALIALALGFTALGLTACDVSDAAPPEGTRPEGHHAAAGTDHAAAGHEGMAHDHDAMAHATLDAADPADFSIYHAGSTWTDQTGTERPLGSLAGRVRLVAMLYTNCGDACPRIMLDLKRIEGELGAARDDVGFVIVSIDPERDSPAKLAEFARGSRLDPDRWTLLTGDEGDVLEMAALLGVQYRQTAPGEWVHSNLITVLDADGVVAHRQLGLGTDPAATLDVIHGLLD